MASEQDKKQHQGKPQGGGGGGGGRPSGSKPKDGGSKKSKHDDLPAETGPKTPPRLKVKFEQEIRSQVAEKFGIKNPMAMPKLEKIVLNVNMGRHIEGTKIPPHIKAQIIETLTKVTGQKPIVIKAKKSVANFKLRAGYESSVMVTIRRDRMWHFLDRFINLATPRIKDFRGLSDTAFDRQGNYATGVTEQGVFPEINMAEANFTHGMNINVCFARSTKDRSRFVLEQLGMPFKKPEVK